MQRPLNTATRNIARDGAPKATPTPATVPGQQRQTRGEPSAYHHGVTVQDEPNTTKTYKGGIPLHPSTPARAAAALDPVADNGGEILRDAQRLGQPPEKA